MSKEKPICCKDQGFKKCSQLLTCYSTGAPLCKKKKKKKVLLSQSINVKDHKAHHIISIPLKTATHRTWDIIWTSFFVSLYMILVYNSLSRVWKGCLTNISTLFGQLNWQVSYIHYFHFWSHIYKVILSQVRLNISIVYWTFR